jgi:UDP-2,3-diacylglucosamine pyrophosphatase LpxH
MKTFILSDLHIGFEGSQYDVMDQAIKYIRAEAKPGDSILGLGDWFHMNEAGFEFCLAHPMSARFRKLAGEFPTRLMPGNHDHHLEKYIDAPDKDNPVSPIKLIRPFAENGVWYCHGHEFDPVVQYAGWLPTLLGRITGKKAKAQPYRGRRTPSYIKETLLTEKYLMVVQLIYMRASLFLKKTAREEGKTYQAIVLGHTHLPFQYQSPELPVLLDDGDMRHNGTFVVREDDRFDLMQWDAGLKSWVVSSSMRI